MASCRYARGCTLVLHTGTGLWSCLQEVAGSHYYLVPNKLLTCWSLYRSQPRRTCRLRNRSRQQTTSASVTACQEAGLASVLNSAATRLGGTLTWCHHGWKDSYKSAHTHSVHFGNLVKPKLCLTDSLAHASHTDPHHSCEIAEGQMRNFLQYRPLIQGASLQHQHDPNSSNGWGHTEIWPDVTSTISGGICAPRITCMETKSSASALVGCTTRV
jgi:hypothetical protein